MCHAEVENQHTYSMIITSSRKIAVTDFFTLSSPLTFTGLPLIFCIDGDKEVRDDCDRAVKVRKS